MNLYYILENVYCRKPDLPVGLRIICINSQEHPYLYKFELGDGPFHSIDDLKKNSKRYKKLVRDNLRRAQKICNPDFIISIGDAINYPANIDEELDNQLFHILNHIISGDITKKNISGIHFFNPKFHRITEITKTKNSRGIWEARIEGLRSSKKDWIPKNKPTTFFPTDWNYNLLVRKIHEAFKSKKKITESRYLGQSNCGIKIEFFVENQKIRSIYPIYE